MYVIVREMKVEKGNKNQIMDKFNAPFRLQTWEGFIKREVWVDDKNPLYDIFRIQIYWRDRKDYYAWESSDEHKAMHATGSHGKSMPGVIDSTKFSYSVVSTMAYQEKNAI